MKGKGFLLVVLVVVATVTVAGCVDALRRGVDKLTGGECTELEEEIEDRPGMDCRCYPTDVVPEGIKNETEMEELEGKCYCTCSYEGSDEEVNVSVVEGPGGETIISPLS
ncbi:MAG: hypothetical protein ACLFTQ_01100 [Candidatus Aenigmatarchaeota archaeon]